MAHKPPQWVAPPASNPRLDKTGKNRQVASMPVTIELRSKGLCHDDFFVRSGVLESFQYDLEPGVGATLAVMEAIRCYGWQNAFEWPHMLTQLPQDRDTVEWIFQQLSDRSFRGPTSNMRLHLARWFSEAPLELIPPNLERLEAAYSDCKDADANLRLAVYLEAARERVQFASESDGQCLARLERTFAECHEAEEFPQRLLSRAQRLCEQLARTGDRARLAKLASKWLAYDMDRESDIGQWKAGIAIRLAGLLQHRPALSRLIDMFNADWDWWNEEIETALAAMNDTSVLSQIVSQFPDLPDHARLYISGALTKARFPGAEESLLRLLGVETDELLRANFGKSLALFGTASSMQAARDLLADHPGNPEASQIIETLYAYHRLISPEQPTELVGWRRVLETSYQRLKSIEAARN